MPGKTLFNGQTIEPGLSADRAFHFGDGLFETLAVVEGVPCLWHLHWLRLRDGCERLQIPIPHHDRLQAEARQLAKGRSRAVLKIIVSAGQAGRGYQRVTGAAPGRWLQISDWPDQPHYQDSLPLQIQWCETRLGDQPLLAGIKHLNRLEQVLARQEIRQPAVEGLVLDQQGNVIEGSMSNLILKQGDTYVTPALTRCGVAGVVRRLLLDRVESAGANVEVVNVTRRMVEQAERLFLTNSLLGVRPVARLGDKSYSHQGLDPLLGAVNEACFSYSGEA